MITAAHIEVRCCHGHDEFAACADLERAVWGSPDIELVPSALFAITTETGGQVLGAFEHGRMIGFTLAVGGCRGGSTGHRPQPYLHSHMTAVLPDYRNLGVGRKLKLFQREEALSRGIALVEWTFDPLELRNAYFNLVRLGAIVRRFLPDLYGITASPLHSGMPTDRFVAEWWLSSARVEVASAGPEPQLASGPAIVRPAIVRPKTERATERHDTERHDTKRTGTERSATERPSTERPGIERIDVPSNIAELKISSPQDALEIQTRLREKAQHWLSRGRVITGIETRAGVSSYLVEHGSQLEDILQRAP